MVKICVTVDTEGDAAENPYSTFFGIKYMLPIFINLFKKYKIKATFFVQEDGICDVASRFEQQLKEIEEQGHEIGYHAHGLIGSSDEKISNVISKGLQRMKDLNFTPVSFRAGRFHYRSSMTRMLEEQGILFESSVCPGLREVFSNGQERCNHIGCPVNPYKISYNDYRISGNSSIIEIPVNMHSNDNPVGLKGGHNNDEVLFDFFSNIRKDSIVIIVLHSWSGLNPLLLKFIRKEAYGSLRKLNYSLFSKLLHGSNSLFEKKFLRNFENLLLYIKSQPNHEFITIKDS
ncbi:polysaccharide deacetylase family protein, partial [Euryarchaeota archaeon]|nr:polysaccharide deacetylase family protein [Euryarchaeota archaeon]